MKTTNVSDREHVVQIKKGGKIEALLLMPGDSTTEELADANSPQIVALKHIGAITVEFAKDDGSKDGRVAK